MPTDSPSGASVPGTRDLERDMADTVGAGLDEPDASVASDGDALRLRPCRRQARFGENARRGDAADLISAPFGKPERTVAAGDDSPRLRRSGGNRIHVDDFTAGVHGPNDVALQRRPPQISVGTDGHA